jgi:hypothetical protein
MRLSFSKKFLTVTVLVLTFLTIGTFVLLLNAKPVLVEWHYGSICDPSFVILNPLRNREAESVVDNFLETIKSGNLEVINNIKTTDLDRLKQIKDAESESKIISWFAADRKETENKISITYWIERNYRGHCQHMPTIIDLEKKESNWKVVKFNPTY